MATTNFLIWNPGMVNQETDSAYASDSQRSGGASASTIFASILANKLFYQLSTFVAAFAQMMANKGFTMSDANYATLTATLANVLTTADSPVYSTPTFSSALALNASGTAGFYIGPMTSNTTITLTGLTEWQEVEFMFEQNSTGGFNVAYPANMVGFAAPDPTANSTTFQKGKVYPDGKLHAISPAISS